mmetsp:Transcript_38904/g.76464  ORF Transcript_38904/g.76464 Transcript_38904/m.76464 type:complete len:157 (+) Transcript_38904:551-1021(+)
MQDGLLFSDSFFLSIGLLYFFDGSAPFPSLYPSSSFLLSELVDQPMQGEEMLGALSCLGLYRFSFMFSSVCLCVWLFVEKRVCLCIFFSSCMLHLSSTVLELSFDWLALHSANNVEGRAFEHGRLRHQCKACGGNGICEHGRQRSKCKECGRKGIC